jgi:hypothetical protein
MKIKTDFTLVTDMINLIETKSYQNKERFDSQIDMMSKSTGFKKMIQFYEGMFNFDEYKEILFLALNKLEYNSNNELLKMLYENLKRVNSNFELLKNKVESLRLFNFESMLHRLESTLPEETDIELNLYFVFDGINVASIHGEDSILLNTMFWPSEKQNEDLVVEVLLHEYHHIALKYWLRKYGYLHDNRFENSKTFLDHMTASILGEGAATYFFTKSNNIYPLILESHGEAIANTFKASVENRAEDVNKLLENLNADLIEVFNNPKSVEELAALSSKYSFDPSGKEPLDKTIGFFMCHKIDKILGREQLINCFKNLNEFYEKYNIAAKKEHDFVFSSELYK